MSLVRKAVRRCGGRSLGGVVLAMLVCDDRKMDCGGLKIEVLLGSNGN